jgi:signal transduction histidine kinase
MRSFLSQARIRTKLALMILIMMALTLGIHFLIETHYEKVLVDLVQNQTEDLSKALEISVQQMTSKGQTDQQLLQDYVQRLSARGVSEISILSSEWQVLASSNQAKVGTRVRPPHHGPKGPLVISGTLGRDEEVSRKSAYNLDIPIIVDDQKQGYIRLHIILDDFAALLRAIHRKRSLATSLVFLSGVGASLLLAYRLTSPLKRLSEAAERVSAGNLDTSIPVERGDEIGRVQSSFNRMIEKLRENRRLESQLRRAERAGALGRLASAVAHEIRNPLNFVSLSIDHLGADLRPEDPARARKHDETVRAIKEELHRVDAMIGEFLSYGRPGRLRLQSCRLEEVLQEVLRLSAPLAARHKVAFRCSIPPDLPPAILDPEGMRTCLQNLVTNGIQAMPRGGRLDVRIQTDGAESLSLYVVDQGVGIELEDRDRIFEPYFSTKEAGVGLGLAITRRIIQDHDGEIGVSSAAEGGTEFHVRLPLHGPQVSENARPSRKDPAEAWG